MKRFIISFLFILVSLFAIDRLGGKVMWEVNQHTHDVSGPKIKYLVNDVHEDVILMGTSRCNLHYVPAIISDSIGMSVYNGGIDASNNIYAHYMMLNHILSHHIPKVICLEVMGSDFSKQAGSFNTITYFAPYIGKNERADSIFRLAGLYWKYNLSHLYRYNAKAVSNIAGLAVNRQEGGDNGYIPHLKPFHYPEILENSTTPTEIDEKKIEFVQRFINLCQENHVKLIFMVSPKYTRVDASYYNVLKTIALKNDIPFLDYHTRGLFLNHPDYFYDASHLWDKGAKIYSSIFASDLKRII